MYRRNRHPKRGFRYLHLGQDAQLRETNGVAINLERWYLVG